MSASRFRSRAASSALIVASLAVALTGTAGSLFIRPSIAASLAELLRDRRGGADVVITAPGFVDESLAERLSADHELNQWIEAVVPAILLDGMVGGGDGTQPVRATVYGVDDRYWRLHAAAGVSGPQAGTAFLSPALEAALAVALGAPLTIRVGDAPDAPAESVHGRKDGAQRLLRLTSARLPDNAGGARLSLTQDERSPYAAFIPLALAQEAGRGGRVNLLLLKARPGLDARPDTVRLAVERQLSVADFGLTLRTNEAATTLVLESTTGRISTAIADRASRAALGVGALPSPVVTSLVTSVRKADRTIAWAFVTGIELQDIAADVHAEESSHPPMVLNEISARRLAASVGDTIAVDYPVWVEPGRLETHQAEFEVASIVPLSGPAADRTLTPSVPGISGAASIASWQPRLPIDRNRIGSADEEYWSRYAATPIAFIGAQVGRALWRTRSGELTSLRIAAPEGLSSAAVREQFVDGLRRELTPDLAGMAVRSLRDEELNAVASNRLVDRALRNSIPIRIVGLLLAAALFAAGPFTKRDAVVLGVTGMAVGLVLAGLLAGLVLRGLATAWPQAHLTLHLSRAAVSGALLTGVVGYALLVGTAALLTRRVVRASLATIVIGVIAWGGFLYVQRQTRIMVAGGSDATQSSVLVRTTWPMIHDPADSPEGATQLGLTAIPDVRVWPFRVRDGDDVSSLNLLHPVHPRIMSIGAALMSDERFAFTASLDRSDEERANPWLLLAREQRDPDDPSAPPGPPIVPVMAGAAALSTLFAGRLGADFTIAALHGPVRLRAVATLAASILDEALVMSDAHFLELFPEVQGYRMLLVDVPAELLNDVAARIPGQLSPFGATVEWTKDRLDAERSVARTLDRLTFSLLAAALVLAVGGLTTYTLSTTP